MTAGTSFLPESLLIGLCFLWRNHFLESTSVPDRQVMQQLINRLIQSYKGSCQVMKSKAETGCLLETVVQRLAAF